MRTGLRNLSVDAVLLLTEPHRSRAPTPDQEQVIEGAIRAGFIRPAGEFIEKAVEALPRRQGMFNAEGARLAGARIRELGRGVTLDRGGMSIREMAHL